MKTFKLPKEFTEKWLVALKSKEYEQGRDKLVTQNPDILYTNDRYCCLGVALRVCNVSTDDMGGFGEPKDLSPSIPDEFPSVLLGSHEELTSILMRLNDGFGSSTFKNWLKKYPDVIFPKKPNDESDIVLYSFEEIADFIEKNVELI